MYKKRKERQKQLQKEVKFVDETPNMTINNISDPDEDFGDTRVQVKTRRGNMMVDTTIIQMVKTQENIDKYVIENTVKKYQIMGVEMTLKEIRDTINQSHEHIHFNWLQCLHYFISHVVYFFVPLPINLFLIWLIFGGNCYPLYNQRYLFNTGGFQETNIILISCFYGYFIYVHLYLKDSLEEDGKRLFQIQDIIQFFIVCLCRAFVISVRYGYNSFERMQIFKKSKTPPELFQFDFIATSMSETDVEQIKDRIILAMDKLRIERNSVVFECDKNQNVANYDETREQLLDYQLLKEKYDQKMETKNEESQPNEQNGLPQTLQEKQQIMFGRSLIPKIPCLGDKISKIYQIGDYKKNDNFDAVNIGLLIFKDFQQNHFSIKFQYGIPLTIFYATIPVIWHIRDKDFFFKENMIIFALQWLPIIGMKLANFIMMRFYIVFLQLRIHIKQHILTMIDPKFAIFNKITPFLPQVLISNYSNIKNIFDFWQIMLKFDEVQLLKTQTFFAGIFGFYSLQFIQISFQVLVSGIKLKEQGELLVIYSFCNTLEVLTFLLLILRSGSQVNALDHDLKQTMVNIHKENEKMKEYSAKKRLYRKDGIIHIIERGVDSIYRSRTTNEVYSSLDGFEQVEFGEHCREYNEQVGQTLDYMDNQIEYNHIKIFGLTMNSDLTYQVLSVFLSLSLAILQAELASEE